MLSLTTQGLQMQHVRPMAYLDHWAFRRFSTNPALSSRLVKALRTRNGTLALSWLNLGEYAKVSVVASRQAAEKFVDDVLPSIFCIQVDLAAVDKREKAGDPLPHADEDLAATLVDATRSLTAKGMFVQLHDAGLADTKDRLAATVKGRLDFLRSTHETDADFRRAVRHSNHADAIANTTRTRAIVRTLAATFFPDRRMVIKPNDAIDFLHAAIPTTYCDAVLLDGATWDRVERARQKLKGTGITIATAFPGRGDGVERFLTHLEK
jgi:hypothetical protein